MVVRIVLGRNCNFIRSSRMKSFLKVNIAETVYFFSIDFCTFLIPVLRSPSVTVQVDRYAIANIMYLTVKYRKGGGWKLAESLSTFQRVILGLLSECRSS
jgi:hypothetical protein